MERQANREAESVDNLLDARAKIRKLYVMLEEQKKDNEDDGQFWDYLRKRLRHVAPEDHLEGVYERDIKAVRQLYRQTISDLVELEGQNAAITFIETLKNA